MLLNGASYRGESVIGIRADQTDGTNDQNQDHGEHHRVFGNVLAAIICPELGEETAHDRVPFFENQIYHMAGSFTLANGHMRVRCLEISLLATR